MSEITEVRKDGIEMWLNYAEFEIDIRESWKLWLGPELQIIVPFGHVFGRISREISGLELRKDKNFISSRPLFVYQNDPYLDHLKLWAANQKIYGRDDCVGYIPIRLQKGYIDDFDEYIELPNNEKTELSQCMYLGSKPDNKEALYLSVLIPWQKIPCPGKSKYRSYTEGGMYSVHKKKDSELVGYLFTIGIWGPEMETFHSDEGYYEVAVMRPSRSSTNEEDFTALLGMQNELNYYDVEYLIKAGLKIENLEWIEKHAKHYWKPPPPEYTTLHSRSGTSSSFHLDPGTYILISEPKKKNVNYGSWMNCGPVGEDNHGRRLEFPGKGLRIRRVKSGDNPAYAVNLPRGGYCHMWDGNLLIKMDGKNKNDEKEAYRMYTDLCSIEYGKHHMGDMSEYDKDPNKTVAKLEKAMKRAKDDFMRLPDPPLDD